jgi:hypothetical protein
MKKIAMLLSLLLFAGLAFAAGKSVVSTYTLPATNLPPIGAHANRGIPLSVEGQPITNLTVSILDYNDGGTGDDDYLVSGTLHAWRSQPNAILTDGGGGWTRETDLDVYLAGDAGWTTHGSSQMTRGFSRQVTITNYSPSGGKERLYYSTTNVLNVDGGTQAHRIIINGHY